MHWLTQALRIVNFRWNQGLYPGFECIRPQITRLSEKLHRYNVHTKILMQSSNLKHERIYIGEQACTGNECCIVFFIRYSHFGHNEVIYADQKLNRYTECENTSYFYFCDTFLLWLTSYVSGHSFSIPFVCCNFSLVPLCDSIHLHSSFHSAHFT